MKLLKQVRGVVFATFAAGVMLGAQAANVAVAVKSTDEKTLTFYYMDVAKTNELAGTVYVVPENAAKKTGIPWYVESANPITNVVFDASFADCRPTSTAYWFYNFEAITVITDIKNLNTSSVTNMGDMFYNCSKLTALDVSGFDTAKVTGMLSMFQNCSALTALDVSGFDTAKVTSMSMMFYNCSALTALDVSGFDTAKVTQMGGMFQNCSALTALDVSGFDTVNATGTSMGLMFNGCSALTVLDLSGFDTAKVTLMYGMFYGCSSLKTIYASDAFKTAQVTISGQMFTGCSKLVGGSGTGYNENVLDRTYARIDNLPSTPGYFTRGSTAITIADVTGATAKVYTNDTVEIAGPPYKVLVDATDVKVVYTAADGYMFPGDLSTFTTNVTANGAKMTVALTDEQQPIAKSHAITYAYKTNDVDVVETELTGLVNDAQTTFREIDSVEIETSKISLPRYRLIKAEPASWAAHEKTSDITVTISFDLAPIPPVTVVLPEVASATAQLLAFNVNGGWTSVATNEVPSNATVRVVWTVTEDGKALSGEGAVNAFQWQTEFVASNSVQTAPQPIVGEAGESEITLNIDTRTKKTYFEKDDILPIWAAQDAEVEVEKVGGEKTSLVKNMSSTNTFAWVPAEQGTYNFSQSGFNDAQIIYTTPVEVTTNGLEVSGTTVAVTADGSPIEPQTEGTHAGKLMVASNSTVTATWTATGSGVYFMDGSTTYTQTFEASQSVNPVSEAVTKPEEPKAPKLKLGVVAQRYPWDGKIDVQYWAQNTPNEGYQITVTVQLPDGTTASETKPCLNGKNVTDFDARAAFGEVQFKSGVKVKATLSKAE